MSSSGDVNSNTDEGLRRRKERSLEELEHLLGDLKTDADQMSRSTRGVGWSKRVYNIQKALREYKNACDIYAAYLLDRKKD
jgi:hypothetical protein